MKLLALVRSSRRWPTCRHTPSDPIPRHSYQKIETIKQVSGSSLSTFHRVFDPRRRWPRTMAMIRQRVETNASSSRATTAGNVMKWEAAGDDDETMIAPWWAKTIEFRQSRSDEKTRGTSSFDSGRPRTFLHGRRPTSQARTQRRLTDCQRHWRDTRIRKGMLFRSNGMQAARLPSAKLFRSRQN